MKLCIRYSIQLPELIEKLKEIFVKIAKEEISKRNEEISVSKISVISGVHRKDVTRFIKNKEAKKPKQNIIARIMVKWQHSKKFTTSSGSPRVLNAEGRNSEFSELVESVTGGDLGAYPILHEMERLGIIEKKGSRVKLLWRDYVVDSDSKKGISLLAEDSNDLANAIEENIFNRSELPNLHLKTSFDKIDSSKMEAIRKWLLEEGSLFHKKVRNYLASFDADTNPKIICKEPIRVVYGSFSLTEEGKS